MAKKAILYQNNTVENTFKMLNIIRNNPYRFLGICANSPAKDRVANTNKLKAYLKVGKDVAFPLDLTALLPAIQRTAGGLDSASNSINLPKDQLKYALFWFINDTAIDKMALEYLQTGNTAKASELFKKKETFSSLINQGVLAFIVGDYGTAIQCVTKVIHDDDYCAGLIDSVCGSTFQISEDEIAQIFIESLLEEIDVRQLTELFREYGDSLDDDRYLRKISLGGPIAAINSAISQAKKIKNDDAAGQYQAGVSLMNTTKADLQTVRSILGTEDEQYQMVADNLAKQILQCGINYYNNASEDEDVEIEKAYTLQNYALSIAVGRVTKDRCKENVDVLKKKKAELPPKVARYYDKKIKEAVVVYMTQPNLISHAIDLIKKVVPYLMSIKEVLGVSNTYYLKMSTLIVNVALHNVIEEFNNALNDGTKMQLIVDREGTIRKLKKVFDQAWKATLYMDKLDMEPDFKRGRYSQNRNSLKEQVEQLVNVYQSVVLDMRGETKFFNDCRSIKDYNNYTSIFPDGRYASQVKDRIEKLEFEACKTTQDCKKFKDKYPHTKYAISNKWEECYFKQCSTIKNYEGYLQAYPNGAYVSQAECAIDKLTFFSCVSVSDYKNYLTKYPHGKYFSDAKHIVADEEMWSRCLSADSRDMYKRYLASFPNGIHKSQAEQNASACYIATMVYGDYDHPQVIALRGFRDNTLRKSVLGRAFISFYYQNSPAWVEKMQDKKAINRIIRTLLDKFIKLYNYENR